jgi:hypothetical protein
MGRGLSPLQHAIMAHVKEHGSITPSCATGLAAFPMVAGTVDWNHKYDQRTAEASAYRSLHRLSTRGLLCGGGRNVKCGDPRGQGRHTDTVYHAAGCRDGQSLLKLRAKRQSELYRTVSA